MEVSFVTNFCPHYRVRTFETLAQYYDVDYYFYSVGDEWYWQQKHQVHQGSFRFKYLPGFKFGQTRISYTLPWQLWSTHYDVYIKCINGKFALPVTYIVTRLKRKPFILWTGIWSQVDTSFHKLFFPITRFLYRHADAVVVYGEHVKQYLMGEGVPAEKIFLANHAVDNQVYSRSVAESELTELREQLQVNKQQKVILYLGRLEEVKGLNYLIEAFSLLPNREDSVLILAGAGSDERKLKELVDSMGISSHVRFAGYTPVEQTVFYYALATVFVLPSVTVPAGKETWGLVVNEAMNQGTPVITTDAVGAAAGGLVQDGVNGFVVPERDSAALAQALQKILSDPTLREKMSQHARTIIAEWDNEQMVMGFRQAIDYVTGNHR